MSTLKVIRLLTIFVFGLLGFTILFDGVSGNEEAVADPFVGAVMVGIAVMVYFLRIN